MTWISCNNCADDLIGGPIACQMCVLSGMGEGIRRQEEMMLSFVLPCVPTAQQRTRHATRNGRSVAYKSAGQKANERILDALLARHVPAAPMAGAVSLEFRAVFPVPKSAGKSRRADMLCGRRQHTHRPDLDNLAKQLKDAMTRLQFWYDDRQVVRLICQKAYGEAGCWEVCVCKVREGETI